MFEQLRVVLLVYLERLPIRRLLKVGVSLLIGLLVGMAIPLAFGVPPRMIWSAFVAFRIKSITPQAYLLMSLPAILVFVLFVGSVLKMQMVSWRSRLLPDFVAPHFIVALGLSAFATLALVTTALVSGIAAHWTGMSVIGLIVVAWSFALLLFAALYTLSPAMVIIIAIPVAMMGAAFGAIIVVAVTGRSLPQIFAYSPHPAIVAMLAVVNVAAVLVLGWRMSHVHEETREYWWSFVDKRETQRRIWSENQSHRKSSKRATPALDEMPERLGSDLLSQIGHIRLGLAASRIPFVRSTLISVGVLWVLNLLPVFRDHGPVSLLYGFGIGVSVGTYLVIPNGTLQSLFMLPFHRTEFLTRYGAAMLITGGQAWFSTALAVYIATWMPFPGTIHALPSLWPFAGSFLIQFPIFGAFSLLWSRPRGAVASVVIVMIILASVGVVVLNVYGYRLLFTMTTAALGAALIALSHRRWRQFEFD